eukprot:6491142-Amphidinium_carterae.3
MEDVSVVITAYSLTTVYVDSFINSTIFGLIGSFWLQQEIVNHDRMSTHTARHHHYSHRHSYSTTTSTTTSTTNYITTTSTTSSMTSIYNYHLGHIIRVFSLQPTQLHDYDHSIA